MFYFGAILVERRGSRNAGVRFAFDTGTLGEAVDVIETEIERLETEN